MKTLTHCLLLMAAFASCTELEDPDNITPDQKIRITAGRNVLTANGKDTTFITAIIPLDAGEVDISFSTSAGTFPLSGGQSISEFAILKTSYYRYAKVLFQSDSTVNDQVWITAEVSQARNRYQLTFKK